MAKKGDGVKDLGGGKYEVRGTWTDPTRRNRQSVERVIEATSHKHAAFLLEQIVSEEKSKRSSPTEPEVAARETFGESVWSWLDARKPRGEDEPEESYAVGKRRNAVRHSTDRVYRSWARAWERRLGADAWCDALTPRRVNEIIDVWLAVGDTPVTINARLRFLRAWAHAKGYDKAVAGVPVIEEDEPDHNAPVSHEDEENGRGLSSREVGRFLEDGAKVFGDLWPIGIGMFSTGMRIGEVLALQVQHFNPENGRIAIRRSVWEGHLGPPKTAAGRRDVYLMDDGLEVWRAHLATLRDPTNPEALLFPSSRPSARHPFKVSNGVRRRFHAAYNVLGIDLDDRPPLHTFRHTFNNVLRQVVSEEKRQLIIGHSDAKMGRVYSVLTPQETIEATTQVLRLVRSAA